MKRKILNVMPECYVDTNLIEYLLDGVVNHQHCCSKVVGQLNNTFADKFAIGIIDKDKVELGYIQDCDEIAKTEHLTLLKHKSRHQYLITISPAVWINLYWTALKSKESIRKNTTFRQL